MLKPGSFLCHMLIACGLMIVAAGLLTSAGSAQALYGTITGIITDASGAVVPSASVKVVEMATGISREVQTNAEGAYIFPNLIPGTYQVTVSATGFTSQQQNGISVLANTVVRANLQLAVGAVTQDVQVTTAPPILQTETAVTDYNISPQQITELPTTSSTGRNFQSLYRLVPGSTPPTESNSAAANPQRAQSFNVNGISNASNTTRIDGAVDAYPWLPQLVAYLPPTDGIESINVVTGSFNAEQGAAGGSAVNVTIKSGTNQLHGSVWEYNSIANFNAQAWQNRTGIRQKNIYNEFGAAVGGPILKSKLFFFADFNRVSVIKTVSNTLSVPTMAMRAGNFASTGVTIYDPVTGTATGTGKKAFAGNLIPSNRFAPAAMKLLAKLPAPNIGDANALINNYFATGTNSFYRYNFDGKITYVPSQTTSIFGHYSASPNDINDPQAFGINPGGPTMDGGAPGTATGMIQNVGLGVTHAFTSKFLIDGNFGFTRQRLDAHADDISLGDYGATTLGIPGTNYNGAPLYGGIPAMTFTTYTNYGNATTGSPFGFYDNQYTGNLNGTYTHNSHALRFGGEYLHVSINHFQPGSGTISNGRGTFQFNGGITAPSGGTLSPVNAFADFLLGQAYQYGKGIQTFDRSAYRGSSFSFFAQDTWQVTNKLTLNYGIRYEYYPLPVSAQFGLLRYDPSVRSTVTDNFGTHTVGTVLVGGMGGNPTHVNTTNGWGNFVPRFGVSYRTNDKTVVRSGFGMTVDPGTLFNLLQSYPQAVANAVTGANTAVASTSLNPGLLSTTTQVGIPALIPPSISSGFLPLPASVGTYTIPQAFRRGYIYSFNLAVQRELPKNFTTTVTYVGTISVRQQTSVNINAAPPGGGQAGRQLNTLYGANTNNTDVTSLMPFRGSNYNGLQAQLQRHSEKHGATGLVYTYSKAMNSSDNGQTTGGGATGSGLVFGHPNYWNRDYARAGYDRKHNFQWWTSYPLPFGPGQFFFTHGVAGYILGNWKLSTILSRVSGTPFTVTASSGLLNAPGNTQVADRNYAVNPILNKNTNGSRQYLNYAAFSDVSVAAGVTTARFGTSGRNVVRGPGFFLLDASLKRSFPIRENLKLDFSADAFDITNTPQFANPAAAINTVTTTNGVVNLGGFGTITTSNVNRTLRLSGRISF